MTDDVRTVAELIQEVAGLEVRQGAADLSAIVTGVVHDSRKVEIGNLFVAFSGEYFDGHVYFPEVIRQGAVALVGSRSLIELQAQGITIPTTVPYISAADTRLALARLAAAFYQNPSRSMTVIGITGTDGKTTTANILESILAEATREPTYPAGRVGVISTVSARLCGRESDTGFHVTTPDAPAVQRYLAEMRHVGCRYAIIESTSQGLAQHRVDAVDFDVAAITNITHEHLDWHGDRAAYIDAKAGLFRMLFQPCDRTSVLADEAGSCRFAILNADDTGHPNYPGSFEALTAVLSEMATESSEVVNSLAYQMGTDKDVPTNFNAAFPLVQSGRVDIPTGSQEETLGRSVWATSIVYHPDRTQFTLNWSTDGEVQTVTIDSTLLGDFNVQNMLCASSVALALGVDSTDIQQGISSLKDVLGRMERIDCGQPFLALVDFAHSPASLERALLTLRQFGSSGKAASAPRLIAVFGSAGLRDVEKRRLMGQISGRLADFTVITAEDPRTEDLDEINQEIAAGVLDEATEERFVIVADRMAAIQRAVDMAQPGDIVAAFGKGHERSMCFGTTEYPWNEQEAMRQALERAGYQASKASHKSSYR